MKFHGYGAMLLLVFFHSISFAQITDDKGFNPFKDLIESSIYANKSKELWKLTTKTFRETTSESNFCEEIKRLSEILKKIPSSSKWKGAGFRNGYQTRAYEAGIFPENWFSFFSSKLYNDPPELKYFFEIIKIDSSYYLEQFKFKNDFLDKAFKLKKYTNNLFKQRDSLLLSFWFPTENMKAKKMLTDTSNVFILLEREISTIVKAAKFVNYPFVFDPSVLVCISFNMKVSANSKKRDFSKDDLSKVDTDQLGFLYTTPSTIYLPKFELIFSISGNDNRLVVSTGEKFCVYQADNLQILRKIVADEFGIK